MITIQINGKTYKPTQGNSIFSSYIADWITVGILEEVKENKEPQFYTGDIDITTGRPFKSGGTIQAYSTVKDHSILKKLREELEKMMSIEGEDSEHNKGYDSACNHLRKFLTSLEQSQTKEDRTQQTKDITGMLDLCMNVKPQFTPGQMIEVSNDGKKWYKGEFTHIDGKNYPFAISPHNNSPYVCWKYARPITEEVIVPELPEVFDYVPKGEFPYGSGKFIHDPDVQIKCLTKFAQAVTQWIHSQSNKQ